MNGSSNYKSKKDGIDNSRFLLNLEIGLVVFVRGLNTGASSLLLFSTATAARVPWAKFSVRFRAITRAHFTRDQRMFSRSVYISREFQGSFPSSLTCPQKAGMGWEGHASVCTTLCLGKKPNRAFPQSLSLYNERQRCSDRLISLGFFLSFPDCAPSCSFPLAVKWDIAGSFFTLACYRLSTCSPWPPPLALVQSLGVRRQINLGPRIRRARGVRLTILDSCISKYLLIFCNL